MDLQIAVFLNKLGAGTFIDSLTKFISSYLFLIILWTALILIALIFDKTKGRKVLMAVTIAIILHFLISEGIFKILLANFFELRVRPYLAHPDLITALGTNADASFPSSHMASTTAILTVFIYYYKKFSSVWIFSILFIMAMAFARIHNGMHYPTDVLAGTILGIIYGIIAIWTTKRSRLFGHKPQSLNRS